MSFFPRQRGQQRDRSTQQPNSSRHSSKPASSSCNKPLPPIAMLAKRSTRSTAVTESSENENVMTADATGRARATPASENPAIYRTMNTPSLYSGSSASTFDSLPRNSLRRKPSGVIDKYAAQKLSNWGATRLGKPSVGSKLGVHRDDDNATVFGMTPPPPPPSNVLDDRHASMDSAVDFIGRVSLHGFTPPVQGYASSGTPSTRYADSPFSHAPTPSSASSYSPATGTTCSDSDWSPAKVRPAPPRSASEKSVATRSGLPPVRETLMSSSSAAATGLSATGVRRESFGPKANTQATDTPEPAARSLRKPVPNSAANLRVQIPPELAHLNVDVASPADTAPRKAQPPRRPSRVGASNIVDPPSASLAFHSHLPTLYKAHHKGTSSQEALSLPASPAKSRFGFPSRSSSRTRSRRIDSAVSLTPSARQFIRSGTPNTAGASPHHLARRDSPSLLPRPSPAKSPRFGFFSRKGSLETAKVTEKPKRKPSRGPAAGTGHEVYARLGFRGRSGSIASTAYRSASADSVSSDRSRPWALRKGSNASSDASDFDDFLRERVQPVVIRGLGRHVSNGGQHTMASTGNSCQGSNDTHLLPSPFQDAVEDDSSVHARNSRTYSSRSGDSKWNFFQRASAKPRVSDTQKAPTARTTATSQPQLANRAVAHYAMVDHVDSVGLEDVEQMLQDDSSETSDRSDTWIPDVSVHSTPRIVETSLEPSASYRGEGSEKNPESHQASLERSVQQELPALAASLPDHVESKGPGCQSIEQKVPSGALRSRPQGWLPTYPLHTGLGHDGEPKVSCKQSDAQARLSSVGRIPTVVSRRDQERTLPNNSFSRPFARAQPRPSVKPPGSVYIQIRDMASPVDAKEQSVSSSGTRSGGEFADTESSTQTNHSIKTARIGMEVHAREDFLALSPRKNSEQSYQSASSSSDNDSRLDLKLPPQQDDIWDEEYNDFMDEVLPLRINITKSLVAGPVQPTEVLHDKSQGPQRPLPQITQPPASQIPQLPGTSRKATVLTVPQQISRFLQPLMSPMSPDTMSAFIDGYEDTNCSTSTLQTSEMLSGRSSRYAWGQQRDTSSVDGCRDSVASFQRSGGSTHSTRSASMPEAKPRSRLDDSLKLADCPEPTHRSVNRKMDLRLGALMTGKWLSNGRVLFSPAHHEIQIADEPRILVFDGLTSDWAQCIARSYPCAKIYDMSTRTTEAPTSAQREQNEDAPANYSRIPLSSISASFPFPKGFFASVVFRFPTALTEVCYAACIAECRRVLRPGGRLEVVVLDLDLKHMGSKLRLAVRGLKTRMQQSNPNVCLKNLSDVFVRLLGQQGFEVGQRHMMGVPAAGQIPRSREIIASSISSDSSSNLSWERRASDTFREPSGFAEILEGARTKIMSPGSANDEKITKMMARVGRWWYAACYEKALLPSDCSIWSDPALLRECHQQGTSFRLLICHAQKPCQTRRRCLSV